MGEVIYLSEYLCDVMTFGDFVEADIVQESDMTYFAYPVGVIVIDGPLRIGSPEIHLCPLGDW